MTKVIRLPVSDPSPLFGYVLQNGIDALFYGFCCVANFWEVFLMTRFHNFLDALSASLVAAVIVVAAIAAFCFNQYMSFHSFEPG